MEKIEVLDREGRWFVGTSQGAAKKSAGVEREWGIMLYVSFLFEFYRSGAGGGIPAIGIGPAAAGTIAGCRGGSAEQHIRRLGGLLRGAAALACIA